MDLKKRLDCVIQKDKENNPKYLIKVIKSDFYYLINNYFEVDFNDIDVLIDVEKNNYKIAIGCSGDRIKLIKMIPDIE